MFYHSLLEDSINDLDKNNDGAAEMKELQDVVADDNDINTQEIEDAQDAEFGPDDSVKDIMDEAAVRQAIREGRIKELKTASSPSSGFIPTVKKIWTSAGIKGIPKFKSNTTSVKGRGQNENLTRDNLKNIAAEIDKKYTGAFAAAGLKPVALKVGGAKHGTVYYKEDGDAIIVAYFQVPYEIHIDNKNTPGAQRAWDIIKKYVKGSLITGGATAGLSGLGSAVAASKAAKMAKNWDNWEDNFNSVAGAAAAGGLAVTAATLAAVLGTIKTVRSMVICNPTVFVECVANDAANRATLGLSAGRTDAAREEEVEAR